MIVGSPGSGKTILALQFLRAGAVNGERSIYVTFDERPEQVKENVSAFNWDLDRLEGEGKIMFVDATPFRRVKTASTTEHEGRTNLLSQDVMPEITLRALVETVRRLAEEEDVTRLVVDPITSLSVRYQSPIKRRRAMLMLFDALSSTGATCLVTSELRTSMLTRKFQLEEYLVAGRRAHANGDSRGQCCQSGPSGEDERNRARHAAASIHDWSERDRSLRERQSIQVMDRRQLDSTARACRLTMSPMMGDVTSHARNP